MCLFSFRKALSVVFYPAQENSKRYTSQETKGIMQLVRFPGTCDIRYFRTTLFLTSRRPFSITFTKKSYLRSETYIAYKFYTLFPKKTAFQREIFV